MRERMQNDKWIRFLPCAIFTAAIGCLCSMLTGRGAMLLWFWSGITALIGPAVRAFPPEQAEKPSRETGE